MEYDHPVVSLNKNGVVLHWQDPENFMIVLFDKGVSNVTPRLAKREGGDYTAISSGSAFSMLRAPKAEARRGDRVRIVIQDAEGDQGGSPKGNSALQELQVDVNGTVRLTSTAIDDVWSAGSVGSYAKSGSGGTLGYDNFKVGYDNNADDDIADAGDDIQIDDDFASTTMTLTHDDNGNLTDDGVYKYKYDAFNRLTQVRRRVDAESVVAAYEYDGLFRRTVKAVSNSGAGIVAFSDDLDMNGTSDADGIQAGDRSEHYFYAGWRLVETRDGSDNTLGQFVYGTRYIDEPICYDRNTDVTFGGSADDDCLDAGGSQRYTYHQDANWRVVALTDESGAVVERYDYTAYGEPTILCGTAGSAVESGNALLVSSVGNPLMHQGLFRDDETGTYQNRFRQLHSRSGRFMQRDPREAAAGSRFYGSPGANQVDPLGLMILDEGTMVAAQTSQPASQSQSSQPAGPTVIVYDPQDDQNGTAFKTWAENWKGLNPTFKDDDIMTRPIVEDSLKDLLRDGDDAIADNSINHLLIIDHGYPGEGYGECGRAPLTPNKVTAVCDKLAPGATLTLHECHAGKNKKYLCALLAACPKLNKVCGFTGLVTSTGPARSDPDCKSRCVTKDDCK